MSKLGEDFIPPTEIDPSALPFSCKWIFSARVVGYRQWCDKLWNAIRFSMSKLGEDYIPPTEIDPSTKPFSCKWILSVLNKAIAKTVLSLDSYEFLDAATSVYSWWQFQLCDVFIEAIKPYFTGNSWWQFQLCDVFIEAIKPYFTGNDPAFSTERRHAQHTLWLCLDNGLELLHPFMPFVTEELWQHLLSKKDFVRKESIVISEHASTVECWTNDDVELEMDMVECIVRSLRSLRFQSAPTQRETTKRLFVAVLLDACQNIKKHELEIATLATFIISGLFLKLRGSINVEAEFEKLKRKMEEIQKQCDGLRKKTSAPGYQEKVKAHIREADEAKLVLLLQELLSFKEKLAII